MSSGVVFLTMLYLSRTITPEEFGMVGLIMAILFILPDFIGFSTGDLVHLNKVKMTSNDFSNFSKKNLTFGIMIFAFTFILSISFGVYFQNYFYLIISLPVIAFLQFLFNFHNAELIQNGESVRYGVYRLVLAITSLILTVLFVSNLNLTWDGRVAAIIVSEFIILFIALKLSFSTLRSFKIDVDYEKSVEYCKFGLPLLVRQGAAWGINQSDKFIILIFFTLKEVGVYTFAYIIGSIVNVINQAAGNAIMPIVYKSLEKNEGKIIKRLNIYYSAIIMSISLMVGVSSYWFVPLLLGPEYQGSESIILFISLAGGFSGIYRITGGVLIFYKKNFLQMNLLYSAAIFNILLSLLLIPFFEIKGPAIATMISFMLLAYLTYRYSWSVLRDKKVSW